VVAHLARSSGCAILLLTIAACAARPQTPSIQRVLTPVPVACDPEIRPEPAWPDTDEALRRAPDLFSRVQLLVAGRLLRIARERELRAAVEACRG